MTTKDLINEMDERDEQETELHKSLVATRQRVEGFGGDFRPSEITEIIALAVALMNEVVEISDYHEFTEDLSQLDPRAVGQVILKTLPYGPNLDLNGRWPASQKAYWITVGEELGPDWIETFRSVGAFLKRVEGF